jgi:hypothetical protein
VRICSKDQIVGSDLVRSANQNYPRKSERKGSECRKTWNP